MEPSPKSPALEVERRGAIAIVDLDSTPEGASPASWHSKLLDVVAKLDADASVRAVVLTGSAPGCSPLELGVCALRPHLPRLIEAIETARAPWVASLRGTVRGSALELALGCRMRIAHEEASFGFPELRLGLIPAFSGTVRCTRLIGAPAAADFVASGAPISARRACELGLVDQLTTDEPISAGVAFAEAQLGRGFPPPVSERAVAPEPHLRWEERRRAFARPGMEAKLAVLDAVERASRLSFHDAVEMERREVERLAASEELEARRYLFLAEEAASNSPVKVPPARLERVGVIGAGTMGVGIAVALARAGRAVVLVERDAEALAAGRARVQATVEASVKRGKLEAPIAQALLARIQGLDALDALPELDLVIEAVFEDFDVKRALFERLDGLVGSQTLLATNTSYLDPAKLSAGLSHPERFVGLHFFSPAHVMKLIEVVPTPDTSDGTLATVWALATALDKVPVRAGITHGFIGNRILQSYRSAAEELVRSGTPFFAVDEAMRGAGFPMGPFEAQDLAGLDISYRMRQAARAQGLQVPASLGDVLVEAGRLGRKVGAGWYGYPNGRPEHDPAVDALLVPHASSRSALPAEAIRCLLMATMAEEGARLLAEGVAAREEDIDLVKVLGYGFPRHLGGPMFHARRVGL